MISDQRLLKHTENIENSIDKLINLKGKLHYKTPTLTEPILIAQEVVPFLPEVVIGEYGDILSINYIGVIPYLVEAVKEQQKQIEELNKQILELKK